jgi:predicted ATPase/class 3 adenylate cyclase
VDKGIPTGTVTFLFTDIEGSTQLVQRLGSRYREVLERHATIIRHGLAEHDGLEVGTEGDAFFAVFRSAVASVLATAEIQRVLAAEPWPDGGEVRVRMGLHTGEGQLGGDDYIGLDVHRAARIAAAGHGGQVLLSAPTRALVEGRLPAGVGLRDLGPHRLKDLDRPEFLTELVIGGLERDFPPIRSLEIPVKIPVERSSFVGRDRELQDAIGLLASTRLLMLTGPGGTGKTRLAIQVAMASRDDFPDGVFFVDLSPIADPMLVATTIAHVLGIAEQPDRPIIESLKAHLASRDVLLILDNLEHLLPAASVVEELLASGPRVRILATSRIVLNLPGEQEYPLKPLSLPDPDEPLDPGSTQRSEAVTLFVERARAVSPGFVITPENAATIAGIARRLDGLPLAIELAASRVRVLAPGEILSRLEQRLPVLASGPETAPARQRTLRGAIEWSYDLLPAAHQALLLRLSVFAGGCTLDAAEAVCNPGRELGIDTLDGIAALVDQSLLRREGTGGASRFVMLETIRQYGRDRLATDGADDELARRHALHFCELAELAEPHLLATDQVAWQERLEREQDNLRGALAWCLGSREAEIGLRLATALWRFWQQRGYLREARASLEALLAIEGGTAPALRGRADLALGGLTYWLNDPDATAQAYEAALGSFRDAGDRDGEAEALYDLAFVPIMLGDREEATRRAERSLAFAKAAGNARLVAQSQNVLGIMRVLGGEASGTALLGDALPYFRSAGDLFQVAMTLSSMGQLDLRLGDPDAARGRLTEALRLYAEAGNLPGIGVTLVGLAKLAAMDGDHARAVRLKSAAAALEATTGAVVPTMLLAPGDLDGDARRAIGDEAFAAAVDDGRRMTLDDVIRDALHGADRAGPG